jgi:hypothetical protein
MSAAPVLLSLLLVAPADLTPVRVWVAGTGTATVTATITLYAVLEAQDGEGRTWYFTEAPTLRFGEQEVPADRLLSPAALVPRDVAIAWYKLEPGAGSYADRSTPLAWVRTPWGEGWRRGADVHPTVLPDQFPELASGLGVMRFQAEARWGDAVLSSPGLDPAARGGVARDAARVTMLPDLPRWLPQLFALVNTPYLWGNLAWHADDQVASDCADFVVAAWRRAGRRVGYTNSWGMRKHARAVIDLPAADRDDAYLDRRGRRVPFAPGGVRPGDVISWSRHVGVLLRDSCTGEPADLFSDCTGNGYLDASDLVIHTVWKPPTVEGIRRAYGDPIAVLVTPF